MERRENLQCLHHGILEVPQEGRMVQHSVAREALRVPCKLLLSKHVVVLSQRKRGDVDALQSINGLGKTREGKSLYKRTFRKEWKTLFRIKVKQNVELSTTTVPPPENRLITGSLSSFAFSTFISFSTFPERPMTIDGFKCSLIKHLHCSESPSNCTNCDFVFSAMLPQSSTRDR